MAASLPAQRRVAKRPPGVIPGAWDTYGQGPGFAYTAPPGGGAPTTIEHEGVGGSWQHPDYGALLAGDPSFGQSRAEIAASRGTAGRSLSDAIKQAVTRFGLAPTNWNPKTAGLANPIDEATLTAARENPLSQIRQMQETRSRSREDLASALAGRGLTGGVGLESGAVNAGEQRIQSDYEKAEGMGTQNLLDALSGYEGAYGESMNALAREERDAREAAASRIANTYQPTWKFEQDPWTETIQPPTTPAWQEAVFGDIGNATAMQSEDYLAALREWIKSGAKPASEYGWT